MAFKIIKEISKKRISVLMAIDILLLVISIFIYNDIILVFIFILLLNLFILFVLDIYKKYKFEQKRKYLEDGLIDELLKLSTMPKNNDLKKVILKLSSSRNKVISDEFKLINSKIKKGHNPKNILELLKSKYNSEILNKFIELILLSSTTGTVSVLDYKIISDNFIKSKQLVEDRRSLLLMQKYTIIFAGGIIVPGILGVIISLVKKLGGSLDLSSFGFQVNNSLYSITYYCSIIYIIEYILISSIYLSLLDAESNKLIVYIIFLLPLSILVFFISMFLI